jgi:hypothetical protein
MNFPRSKSIEPTDEVWIHSCHFYFYLIIYLFYKKKRKIIESNQPSNEKKKKRKTQPFQDSRVDKSGDRNQSSRVLVQSLLPGDLTLGYILMVYKNYAKVSLPGGIIGQVSINEISDVLNQKSELDLETYVSHKLSSFWIC